MSFWAGSLGFCLPELREDGGFRKAEGQFVRGGFSVGFWTPQRGRGKKKKKERKKGLDEREREVKARFLEAPFCALIYPLHDVQEMQDQG